MAKDFFVDSAVALMDDTTFTYTSGTATTVAPGDFISSRKERYTWRVAASSATDFHLTTAGVGAKLVKLYVDAPVVHPEMFGRIGTTAGDSAAIARAMKLNRDVEFPGNVYSITEPIQVSNQRITGLGKGPGISRAQVLIGVQGDYPCFINKTAGGFNSCEISGFYIDYGDSAPSTGVGNANKIGFRFTLSPASGVSDGWPELIKISNCTVRGAWIAYYDNTGTYGSYLERILALKCRLGFQKVDGTTHAFVNCLVGGDGVNSENGFVVTRVPAVSFTSCAADLLVPGPGSGGGANIFTDCLGVTINGWDAEGNRIGSDLAYFKAQGGGSISVKGFVGIGNTLLGGTGTESFLFFNSGCQFEFTGLTRLGPDDLKYSGVGGNPTTFLTVNNGETLLNSSVVHAATGGTPAATWATRAGLGGSAILLNSRLIGGNQQGVVSLLTNAEPLAAIGTEGMFLNMTNATIAEGQVVPATSLAWSAASGNNIAPNTLPAGSQWMCLGTCLANTVPPTPRAASTSLFRRVY